MMTDLYTISLFVTKLLELYFGGSVSCSDDGDDDDDDDSANERERKPEKILDKILLTNHLPI